MPYVAESECYRDNHCRVLTPDGGQICCSTPAEAARVADDMTRLRAVNAELLRALRDAEPYIAFAYECAFPDAIENAEVLHSVRSAIAKATEVTT